MIQQGRTLNQSLFINHRSKLSQTNQTASANFSSLIGRCLEERVDVCWLTVMKCVLSSFQEVNFKKC